VGIVALGHLDELVDDVTGRRLIRVPHAEVNDILPARSRCRLQLVDDIEDIGRETLDTAELGNWLDHGDLTGDTAEEGGVCPVSFRLACLVARFCVAVQTPEPDDAPVTTHCRRTRMLRNPVNVCPTTA
jgi:hypothetical protein